MTVFAEMLCADDELVEREFAALAEAARRDPPALIRQLTAVLGRPRRTMSPSLALSMPGDRAVLHPQTARAHQRGPPAPVSPSSPH
jgi:hypothetical protein